MVGRLVEQQQVGCVPDQHRQHQPGAFAAGQARCGIRGQITGEGEAAEKVAQALLGRVTGNSRQVEQRTGRAVDLFELVLGEVADPQAPGMVQLAGQRRELAGQSLDQSRLAGAVDAKQADPVASREVQRKAVQHRDRAVAQPHIAQRQQRVGGARRLGEFEVERAVSMGRGELLHAVERLDPGLGLASLGGFVAKAVDEGLHVRHFLLLLFVLRLLQQHALGALAFELRVAAGVAVQRAVIDMDDVFDHVVEEVAVV